MARRFAAATQQRGARWVFLFGERGGEGGNDPGGLIMTMYRADSDNIRTIVLEPRVTRAFWAQARAWNGATVRLHIETKYVPDGTPVTIEVWEDDSAEGNPDDFVTQIEGEHTIENGRCIVEYELSWDDDTLGDPSENEGGAYEFYFSVQVGDGPLQARSNLLYVAVEEFRLSG
ncbi:MAG: hypothetical protein AAF721_14190 [Myxococcota bacterium]